MRTRLCGLALGMVLALTTSAFAQEQGGRYHRSRMAYSTSEPPPATRPVQITRCWLLGLTSVNGSTNC